MAKPHRQQDPVPRELATPEYLDRRAVPQMLSNRYGVRQDVSRHNAAIIDARLRPRVTARLQPNWTVSDMDQYAGPGTDQVRPYATTSGQLI
jgi:hypothetical protein